MSISSSATGLRPGVCTSSTRPTTPYTGQIIYETDTGYLRVWDGSAWDYLSQSQGDTIGLGPTQGLVFIKQVTVGSAVSSVDVTSCFSSTYDDYRIIYSNLNPSTNNDLNLVLLSGTTASTTAYYRGFVYVTLSSGAVTGVGAANTGSHLISSVTSTSFRHAGSVDLFMPYLAQYTGIAATSYMMRTDIAAPGVFGSHQIASSYDGFRISTTSGTLTGGTIRVFGYRNS